MVGPFEENGFETVVGHVKRNEKKQQPKILPVYSMQGTEIRETAIYHTEETHT